MLTKDQKRELTIDTMASWAIKGMETDRHTVRDIKANVEGEVTFDEGIGKARASCCRKAARRSWTRGWLVAASLSELFAWTTEFTPADMSAYAAEIEHLVYVTSELGTFDRLLAAQCSWQATALAYASGLRQVEPVEFLDAPIRVDRP